MRGRRFEQAITGRQLAVFAVGWLIFFGVCGGMVMRRGGPWWATVGLWTAAVAVPAAGGLAPGLLRMLYRLLAGLTWPIGVVCSHALLTATYYCVLSPIGLVQRLLGRDPMGRRFDRQAKSYWVERRVDEDLGRHFRQF